MSNSEYDDHDDLDDFIEEQSKDPAFKDAFDAALKRGIEQAEAGELISLGSFADHDIDMVSHWNYRVVRRTAEDATGETIERFGIIEAYYDGGVQNGYSRDIRPYGESLEELEADLDKLRKAFDLPVIDEDDLR